MRKTLIGVLVAVMLIPVASATAARHSSCDMPGSPYFRGMMMTSYTTARSIAVNCRQVNRIAHTLAWHWKAKRIDGMKVRKIGWVRTYGEAFGNVSLTGHGRRVFFVGVFRINYGS